MLKYVVISGSPIGGFTIIGPFISEDHAMEWAESVQDDWWVTELETPND